MVDDKHNYVVTNTTALSAVFYVRMCQRRLCQERLCQERLCQERSRSASTKARNGGVMSGFVPNQSAKPRTA